MDSDEAYRVQENTEVPAHPSINTVISRALERAADPRPTDHPNGHFDRYIRDALDRFSEDDYVWGINVGVVATAYLRELHQE